MYSIEYSYDDPFAGPKTVTPKGMRVAVSVLRSFGAKVTCAELGRTQPIVGFIRKVHDNGKSMAYSYNGFLTLETDGYQPRELARLHSPTINDWNGDGEILEGWVLERGAEGKLHQVMQLWWVRPLAADAVESPG